MFTNIRINNVTYYQPYASIDVYNKAFVKNILEHNIYRTTFEKTALTLPDTVQMLTVSDGSVMPVPVTWDYIDPAMVESPGSFTVTGATDYGKVTAWVTVIYRFSGFFPPINHLPEVNMATAVEAVPVKFSLIGDHGLSFLAGSYPASQQIACDTGELIGAIVPTKAAESLIYNPVDDQYKYVWKTSKTWAGTCRQLILKFDDGMEYRAYFMFK